MIRQRRECRRRRATYTILRGLETDTPVVDLDILIQLPQSLVNHSRRQNAMETREGTPDLGDDAGKGVVSRI